MADKTGISWTEATWNPVTGCDRVSPGCDHCYALTLAKRLKAMGSAKYQADGDPSTSGPGFGVTVHPDVLTQPLRWKRPRTIFVNSMSDLFHARVPDDYVAQVFAVMAATPEHTYQVLTKRQARMRALLSRGTLGTEGFADMVELAMEEFTHASLDHWPLPNVWLGVSAEDQHWADIRVPALLKTPAAVRFLSCEPLLGPVDLIDGAVYAIPDPPEYDDGKPVCQDHGAEGCQRRQPQAGCVHVDWVIAGGESGPGARPMHPEWARSLRDQCASSGVPFFFKQYGAWRPLRNGEYPPPGETRTVRQRGAASDPILVRHGGHNGDPENWPADMRVRQFPIEHAPVTP